MPLTADNLNKLQANPYQAQQPEFVPTFEIELFNYEDLNQLLHKISTTLVQDRSKLSRWIAGT